MNTLKVTLEEWLWKLKKKQLLHSKIVHWQNGCTIQTMAFPPFRQAAGSSDTNYLQVFLLNKQYLNEQIVCTNESSNLIMVKKCNSGIWKHCLKGIVLSVPGLTLASSSRWFPKYCPSEAPSRGSPSTAGCQCRTCQPTIPHPSSPLQQI